MTVMGKFLMHLPTDRISIIYLNGIEPVVFLEKNASSQLPAGLSASTSQPRNPANPFEGVLDSHVREALGATLLGFTGYSS